MPGVAKIRGQINVVLNRLVREGVISSFRTNFGSDKQEGAPQVTVSVPASKSIDDARFVVADALTEVVIGVKVIAEPE